MLKSLKFGGVSRVKNPRRSTLYCALQKCCKKPKNAKFQSRMHEKKSQNFKPAHLNEQSEVESVVNIILLLYSSSISTTFQASKIRCGCKFVFKWQLYRFMQKSSEFLGSGCGLALSH